jgi:hypothetical protein
MRQVSSNRRRKSLLTWRRGSGTLELLGSFDWYRIQVVDGRFS